jgi:uncharacterized protein (TIGR03435 family)
MRRLILMLAVGIAPLVTRVAAQAPNPDIAVAFEAASVKPNNSGESDTSLRPQPSGRLTATNAPVQLFISYAYQLQQFQLQGAPSWLRTDRFDINATLGRETPAVPAGSDQPTQLMLALRTLLAERFKLAVHWETQDLPIYALILARPDGKLGPNIRPAAVDCTAMAAASAAAAKEGRTLIVNPPERVACGMRNSAGRFQFGGNPLSLFATGLSNQVARTVVDRTGLSGNWDFEFTFTPERVRQQALAGNAPPDADANGSSIFTAIQEQLGLKLESTTGPVRVLVIDRVERPTPD